MTVSTSTKEEAFFVDRSSPPPDPCVDEGAWPAATCEAVHVPVVSCNRSDRMAEGPSPSDASFSSYPRDHEGRWVSATRERMGPRACLLAAVRPHGRRLQAERSTLVAAYPYT